MTNIPEPVRRAQIEDGLRAFFEATISGRVDRHLEFSHQGIIPNHHFAEASAECIRLYVDGHFLSTVMVTQAVAEGIRKFIVACDGIKPGDRAAGEAIVGLLVDRGIISGTCGDAFNRIWRSFRCDVHHMNPKVATIPFAELARGNIQDLATIEREVFACEWNNGMIRPLKPKYWNPPNADGTTDVYLRLGP